MSILEKLASAQGLKGSEANILLAKELSVSKDEIAIKILVDNLKNKDKNIQSDCIKTLYELGYLKPDLIAPFYAEFLNLLGSRNNRLVWGSMIALACIADIRHVELFGSLNQIMECIKKGSVITNDAGVEILSKLNVHPKYQNITDALLIDLLWKCPAKQLPMYIEKSIKSVHPGNKEIYISLIVQRRAECENESQQKRLDKALKALEKIS